MFACAARLLGEQPGDVRRRWPCDPGGRGGVRGREGLRTWHEVSGEGHPVVLLHGAFAGAASWSAQAPVLAAAGYRVHAPERRGHAHTPDVEGPLTYEVMADDSSGKVTGGLVDQLAAGGDQVMGFLRAGYDPVSPDGPEHFPVVFAKTLQMVRTEPELELASLSVVGAPALVLQGDRDEVTLEHGAAVAAVLPHGRLAVLPGTHALPVENPDVVNALLLWFLAGAVPAVDWSGTQLGR
jgi:pimeloyl-ACP methyl ester carboxylesterase